MKMSKKRGDMVAKNGPKPAAIHMGIGGKVRHEPGAL